MRTLYSLLLVFVFIMAPALLSGQHDGGNGSPSASQHIPPGTSAMIRESALSFIENRGQWPGNIRFASRLQGLDLWITNSSLFLDLYKLSSPARTKAPNGRKSHDRGENSAATMRTGHVLRMDFVGASSNASATGMHQQPGYYNYLIGSDPEGWATHVPRFRGARIESIYPGIDAVLYYDGGLPRYDLHLEPGADHSRIRIRYDGADAMRITPKGDLAIATSIGELTQRKLFAYQEIGGRRQQVPCSFQLRRDGTVGFAVGSHDPSLPLVIDPVFYGTFLGGSGDESALGMALDGQKNIYVTGYANSPNPLSDEFPTSSGAYQRLHQGNTDIFITKMNPTLGTMIYSTFIGGTGFEDGRDIVVGSGNQVHVAGYTSSTDFPTTAGAYDRSYNSGSHDAFVLKLKEDGTSLLYSTFIGGMSSDGAYGLALDNRGNLRVCGYTSSTDFPTTAEAYDRTYNEGPDDIFSLSLNAAGSALVSSTFIGGSGSDYAYAIELDELGNSYIFGTTSSTNLPTTSAAYSTSYAGGPHDGMLVKLNEANSALQYCSYFGGSGDDYAYDVEVMSEDDIVFCGYTSSSDLPTTSSAYDPIYSGGAYDIFVSRLRLDIAALRFSTFIGGRSDDYAYALSLAHGNIWLTGQTASVDFPVFRAGYDTAYNGGPYDAFVLELDRDGDSLRYVSFLGGASSDIAHDFLVVHTPKARYLGTIDIYVCGATNSGRFPAGKTGYDTTVARRQNDESSEFSYDAFVVRLDPRNIILVTQTPGDRPICCPNSTFMIRWSSYMVDTITIHLMRGKGTIFHSVLINNYMANSVQEWPWLVPSTTDPDSNYRILIIDLTQSVNNALGAVDFIVPAEPTLKKGISSMKICPGEPFRFNVEASGYYITYRWRRNHFTLFGETGPSYGVDSATPADTGLYEVAVVDACGVIKLANMVRVDFHETPYITEQPQNARPCRGTPALLSVASQGEGARYQWYRDGSPINGATDSILAFDSATEADEGTYMVAVFNDICETYPTLSKAVTLELFNERIVQHPFSQIAKEGDAISFHVIAVGLNPRYQWRKNGTPIPNATTSTYTIPWVQRSDAGMYDVLINGVCSMQSLEAILTVGPASVAPGFGPAERAAIAMNVAPNPANGLAMITLPEDIGMHRLRGASLGLFNALGEQVLDLTATFIASGYKGAEFDAAQLPEGAYYCRLVGDGVVSSGLVVIVR